MLGSLTKPHQDHKPHVSLKLFYGDLGPAGKLFMHSRANWLLCSTMYAKSAGVKNREKIPNGEGGMGTLGPAVPVNGEMLIYSSVDDHCKFSLHV